jgi:hypothetical protein
MTFHRFARVSHRWLSILFTLIVVAIFVMQGFGQSVPQWVYFVPLAPLFLMMLTGLYMFFRPYLTKSGTGA